jgi:hypothetical protein
MVDRTPGEQRSYGNEDTMALSGPAYDLVGWRDQIVSYAVEPKSWCPVHAPASVYRGDTGRREVTRIDADRLGLICCECGQTLGSLSSDQLAALIAEERA